MGEPSAPAPLGEESGPGITCERRAGEVHVSGAIDLATAAVLAAALEEARQAGHNVISLYMAAVSFLDSSGLQVLVAARNHGLTLTITEPSRAVRQVLELTNLDSVFMKGD